MAYSIDLRLAAIRHKEAADLLDHAPPQGRRDVAAYLYGIAAECALKQMMRSCGLRPSQPRSYEDPFYLHFPSLKSALRETLQRRGDRNLLKYANDDSLFQGWDVAMRYAPTADVLEQPVAKWRAQAEQLLQEMDRL